MLQNLVLDSHFFFFSCFAHNASIKVQVTMTSFFLLLCVFLNEYIYGVVSLAIRFGKISNFSCGQQLKGVKHSANSGSLQ